MLPMRTILNPNIRISQCIYRCTDLMKLRELVRTSRFEVYLRQADPSSYLNVLKDIKMKEIFTIIVDIQPENMVNLLNVVSIRRSSTIQYLYLVETWLSTRHPCLSVCVLCTVVCNSMSHVLNDSMA